MFFLHCVSSEIMSRKFSELNCINKDRTRYLPNYQHNPAGFSTTAQILYTIYFFFISNSIFFLMISYTDKLYGKNKMIVYQCFEFASILIPGFLYERFSSYYFILMEIDNLFFKNLTAWYKLTLSLNLQFVKILNNAMLSGTPNQRECKQTLLFFIFLTRRICSLPFNLSCFSVWVCPFDHCLSFL